MIKRELAGIQIGDTEPVRIMGILNLGSESFYKGSVINTVDSAVSRAIQMVSEGADFLDLGAMSTAPGVKNISESEELSRLKPILRAVLDAVDVPISVDTFRSHIADESLKMGAQIINDVSGFVKDENIIEILQDHNAPSIIMATNDQIGDPLTVQDTKRALKKSIQLAESKGYDSTKIIIDPAIGRWVPKKNYKYNIELIKNLKKFSQLNHPILVGISRKSFIHEILNRPDPEDRLGGTLSATTVAVINGAHIVRTHDVKITSEVVKIAELLR